MGHVTATDQSEHSNSYTDSPDSYTDSPDSYTDNTAIWVCMGIYGYVWVYMGIYGYVWVIEKEQNSAQTYWLD